MRRTCQISLLVLPNDPAHEFEHEVICGNPLHVYRDCPICCRCVALIGRYLDAKQLNWLHATVAMAAAYCREARS